MENGAAKYVHDVATIRGRLYADDKEAEHGPGYLMGWEVNNFTPRGGVDSILEDIGYIHNSDGGVVGGSNGDKQKECRRC